MQIQNSAERQKRLLEDEDQLDGFLSGQNKCDEDGDFQSSVESLAPENEHDYETQNQDKRMKTSINQTNAIKS